MASRTPCSGCGVPTTVKGGTCRTCKPQARRTAGKPCDGCGTWTTAAKGTCKRCVRGTRTFPIIEKHALPAGQWVTVRGVRKYVPTPKRKKAA